MLPHWRATVHQAGQDGDRACVHGWTKLPVPRQRVCLHVVLHDTELKTSKDQIEVEAYWYRIYLLS